MSRVVLSKAQALAPVAIVCICFFSSFHFGEALAEPIISSSAIDQYLSMRSSPLTGHGNTFVNEGSNFSVDPRLIVAIAGAETSFGTRICGQFNAWNWFWCLSCNPGDRCARSPFPSWDE